MAKTKIVTTYKTKAGKGKKFARRITSKVHKTHKGYSQRHMVKSHLVTKKGRKR
jgi:hypothetical protein